MVFGSFGILTDISSALSFLFGVLASVFGAMSVKGPKKSVAVAGIVTGGAGILLIVILIATGAIRLSLGSFHGWSRSENAIGSQGGSENAISQQGGSEKSTVGQQGDSKNTVKVKGDSEGTKRDEKTFYGDGYEFKYSGIIWSQENFQSGSKSITGLVYSLDGTRLFPSGVSDMLGYSTATKNGCEELYEEFYGLLGDQTGYFVRGGTESFVVLKDAIYYASYNVYSQGSEEPESSLYVVASEQDDIIVSFVANLESITRYDPDIPILSILSTINFTGRTEEPSYVDDDYEIRVFILDSEYEVAGSSIPSLSSVMSDNEIAYTDAGYERTVGRMVAPSILDYFSDDEPEKVRVEIIEVSYKDVDDAWGAVDLFGRLLSQEYGFHVTYTPTEYPNYGKDYLFCELIKELGSEGIFYVSATYSRDENVIFVRFGIIETLFNPNGIGPLNLENIARAR